MGNSENSSQRITYQNFLEKFEPISKIVDENYGEGTLLMEKAKNRQVFLKEELALNSEEYKNRLNSLQAKYYHPNVISLSGYFTNTEEKFCSRFYKSSLIFEFLKRTLEDEIRNRKNMNQKHFSEDEIWYIIECLVYGLSYLQQMKISHNDLNPTTILISDEGIFKVLNPKSFDKFSNSFTRILTNDIKKISYLSPALLKALEMNNWSPSHNPFKSDVFCLGLCILSAMSLEDCSKIFNFYKYLIYDDLIRDFIEISRAHYSSTLVRFVQDMLILNEEKRPDLLLLRQNFESIKLNMSKQKVLGNSNESTIFLKSSNEKNIIQSVNLGGISYPNSTDQGKFSSLKKETISSKNNMMIINEKNISPSDFETRTEPIKMRREIPKKKEIMVESPSSSIEEKRKNQETEKNSKGKKQFLEEIEQDLESINGILDRYGISPLSKLTAKTYSTNKGSYCVKVSKRIPTEIKEKMDVKKKRQVPIQLKKEDSENEEEFYDYQMNFKKKKQLISKENDKNSYLLSQDYELSRPYEIKPDYDKYEIVVENYSDNSHYEGEKIDDQRSGKGRMVYADKTSYEGSWLNDMREGEGLLLSANEEEIYRGFFKADMFHGKGRLSNNQGKLLKNDFNYLDFNKVGDFWLKYEGDFIQGKKQGFGCLLLSNGEKFEGGFYNDLPDGKGKFTKSNGYVLEAKWKAGKLIRNI